MEHLEVACVNGTALKIRIKNLIYSEKSDYQVVSIYDTYSFGKCLFLDGVIQSSEKDQMEFDKEIVSRLRITDKKLLIIGGGDGHTASIALKLNPKLNITIVDRDQSVINVCREHLGQTIYDSDNVKIVVDDAMNYFNNNGTDYYDGIICDLTDTPLGHGDIKKFYSMIYSHSVNLLTKGGWFTAYVGCSKDIVSDIVDSNNGLTNNCAISIESFGEPCFFVHGHNVNRHK